MREFLFKYNPNFDEGLNLKNSHFKSYFNRIIPIKKMTWFYKIQKPALGVPVFDFLKK